jgi:hypothetical protein
MRRPIEHAIRDAISALVDGRWSRLGGARVHRVCVQPKQERHAGSSATTNHELTSILDHLMGAGQSARTPGRFSSL